jgi:hypothetical protein
VWFILYMRSGGRQSLILALLRVDVTARARAPATRSAARSGCIVVVVLLEEDRVSAGRRRRRQATHVVVVKLVLIVLVDVLELIFLIVREHVVLERLAREVVDGARNDL